MSRARDILKEVLLNPQDFIAHYSWNCTYGQRETWGETPQHALDKSLSCPWPWREVQPIFDKELARELARNAKGYHPQIGQSFEMVIYLGDLPPRPNSYNYIYYKAIPRSSGSR